MLVLPSDLKPLSSYGGQYPADMNSDLGRIVDVQRIVEMPDYRQAADGMETDAYNDVKNMPSFTVVIELLTRSGRLANVPYLTTGAGAAQYAGAMPTRGQVVFVCYVGNRRIPIALGGYNTWETMRRLITADIFPELKEGEILHQAGIRANPMSYFAEPTDSMPSVDNVVKGARVFQDFKGRLILESQHARNGNGAFVRAVFGNPAATAVDDCEQDFNVQDASAGDYVVTEVAVSPSEGTDPVFVFHITQSGKVAFEFTKGWFGRAPGEGPEPETTIEVDVENRRVLLDANEILLGRAAEERAVLGDTLVSLLESLVTAIINMRQPVAGAGPTAGPPVNVSEFLQIKSSLESILSGTNKVE